MISRRTLAGNRLPPESTDMRGSSLTCPVPCVIPVLLGVFRMFAWACACLLGMSQGSGCHLGQSWAAMHEGEALLSLPHDGLKAGQ